MKVIIIVAAKDPILAKPVINSLKNFKVNFYNGSNARSFSHLLNSIINLTKDNDIVIFCSHKVRPVDDDIKFMVEKIIEGYGMVMLYKAACFAFRPEVFKRIGLFDERYEPGGYEDDDLYIRLVEGNIGIYEDKVVEYIPSASTWQQELIEIEGQQFKQPKTYLFHITKWKINSTECVRLLNEPPTCFNLGPPDYSIKIKPFKQSVIKTIGYYFPRIVRNETEIKDKRILIIGGTGSLGQKLMDIYGNDNKLYAVSRDENKHWALKQKYNNINFIIGDIKNYDKICDIICQTKPHIIIIAAALKHIDTCEYEINESFNTNTLGTMNVLKTIRRHENKLKMLETVLFVSTDKACYPINTYGICKALSEKAIIEESLKMRNSRIKYLNIRYGNVLNSRGSIIPKLKTTTKDTYYLTHKDMTRFLMTQEDSVNLINYAIINGESGDTIIPMISAMNIHDLFELYAEKYNKKIEITEIRPGEKMHEALMNINEINRAIISDNYYIIKPCYNFNADYYSDNLIKNMKSYDSCDALLTKEQLKNYLNNLDFL